MNILAALADPQLLGALPAFRELSTWCAWLVFLRAVYGLDMDESDRELFRQHTGRSQPRPGGYPEAVAIVGVQSGKSRIAGMVAAFEAALAEGERDLYALLVAQDHRGALRTLLRYATEPFDIAPAFASEVVNRTADALALRNGVTVAAYPCRPASIRGIRARVAVVDELAFFVTSEGRPVDTEMLRAVRGRLATTGGKLLILSSPYGQTGALWEIHRKHFGRDDSPVLVWQATAPAMNPTLPADYLARMEADDPDAYRSEVLGEFRAGLSTLLDPDALTACVEAGVRERAPWSGFKPSPVGPPTPRPAYRSFVDAASGSGKDAFTLAIAHQDGARAVLDVCRAWRPPFNPSGVIAEAAELLGRYHLRETTGDRYAPGFVAEGFRARGVTYRFSERDRSALYLELLPLVNADSVVLLDDPELLRELRGLERRRGASGRDRVDHRPGAHDDRANAAAGALALASARPVTGRLREVLWG